MKREPPILRSTTLVPVDFDELSEQAAMAVGEHHLTNAEAVAMAREELEEFLGAGEEALPDLLDSNADKHSDLAVWAYALTGSAAASERRRAVLMLQCLSGRGIQSADYFFARTLIQGVAIPRDVPRAEATLQELAEAVEPSAPATLAAEVHQLLADLRMVRGDLQEALRMYEEQATRHAESAFAAAVAYDKTPEDYGIKRDPQKAMALYESAAARGHVKAMTNLGVLLTTCHSQTRSPAEGWELLRKASRLGDGVADEAMERYTAMGLDPMIPRPAYEHIMVRAAKLRNSVVFFLGNEEVDSDEKFDDEMEFNASSSARHELELPSGARLVLNLPREGRAAIREVMARFYHSDDAKYTKPFAFALLDLVGSGRYLTDAGLWRALDEDSSGNLQCGELVSSMFPDEGMCGGFNHVRFACNFYELQFRPSEDVEFENRVQLAKQLMDLLSRDFRVGLHLVATDRPFVTDALVALGGSVVDDNRVAYGLPGIARRLAALNIAGKRLR